MGFRVLGFRGCGLGSRVFRVFLGLKGPACGILGLEPVIASALSRVVKRKPAQYAACVLRALGEMYDSPLAELRGDLCTWFGRPPIVPKPRTLRKPQALNPKP